MFKFGLHANRYMIQYNYKEKINNKEDAELPRYSQLNVGVFTPMIEESIRDDVQEQLDSLINVATLLGYKVIIEKDFQQISYSKRKLSYAVRIYDGVYRVLSFCFLTQEAGSAYLQNDIVLDYVSYTEQEKKKIRTMPIEYKIKELTKLL
ncbi:hypothetical protein D3C81_649860 [compost metagenome]